MSKFKVKIIKLVLYSKYTLVSLGDLTISSLYIDLAIYRILITNMIYLNLVRIRSKIK